MRRGETINEGQRLPTANLFFLACRLSCPSSDRQILDLSPIVYSESASQFTAVRGERAATMLFGNGSGQGRSVLATVAEQKARQEAHCAGHAALRIRSRSGVSLFARGAIFCIAPARSQVSLGSCLIIVLAAPATGRGRTAAIPASSGTVLTAALQSVQPMAC